MVEVGEQAGRSAGAGAGKKRGERGRLYHMRVSVPTIPDAVLRAATQKPSISPAVAVDRIARFFEPGNVAVLTGAGVSVDSGIRAYRGEKGSYLNPNYKCVISRAARSTMRD